MRLVFATHNQGKIREMREILKDPSVEVVSADEAGVTEDPVEDGTTFEENAMKKARFVSERTARGRWLMTLAFALMRWAASQEYTRRDGRAIM